MSAWIWLVLIAVPLFISAAATSLSKRVAARLNMIDVPARHKAHTRPVPLLGGCAIFGAFLGPCLLGLAVARVWAATDVPACLPDAMAVHVPGLAAKAPMALGILACAAVLHIMGIIDDRRALGPWIKLFVELAVCSVAVIVFDVRVLTVLDVHVGKWASVTLSILWLATIVNAFNFLDNMDGLSAGVAAICSAALLAAALSLGQWFVAAWLCLLLGALLGFLPHNFAPASTFMGDAGSLVIGFLLGVASCLTTYVRPEHFYGVFVPVVLLALPLYDVVSVISLRIRERRHPMVGDRRHFSHRLLKKGMSTRAAVLTVYLCTGATAIAATLLPRVDNVGAVLILVQTLAILFVVALLESSNAKS